MNYLLVNKDQLAGQGYNSQYAEHIPDGRIILPLSALKVLSNFTPEIISDDNLKKLIKEQEESGQYDHPQEDKTEPPKNEISKDNPPVNEEGGTA